MKSDEFEAILEEAVKRLTYILRSDEFEAISKKNRAKEFECQVKKALLELTQETEIDVDEEKSDQQFPDVIAKPFGVEVKYTSEDKWKSVANSIRESNRVDGVDKVYLVFGKGGGDYPEARWGLYEDVVVHVRTSHVPRFEVEMDDKRESLFKQMGVSYKKFSELDMIEKMDYVRAYAKKIHPNERLWWFGDDISDHAIEATLRIYANLSQEEKDQARAEAVFVSPKLLGKQSGKYDDAAYYLSSYRGILASNARDMFTAGSAAGVHRADDDPRSYMERGIVLLQDSIKKAAEDLDDEVLKEYWGFNCNREDRIKEWLKMADEYAVGWTPSEVLFKEQSEKNNIRPI